MQNSDLFYKHYDNLYFSKKYDQEMNCIVSMVKNYYPKKINKALEIGAGTGNHTVHLAQNRFSVVAIDTDKKMISAAAKKITRVKFPNVKLLNTQVEKLSEKNFDFAVAGFNVVNYLPDFISLQTFFKAIFSRLKTNGLLIFDCWNGVAAIADPPKSKIIHSKNGEDFIYCNILSSTDFMTQKTMLTYKLSIKTESGKEIDSGSFSFEQTLWTPMEISSCLKNAGFKILKCSRHFQPEISATEKDWKIMFVCQKKT